jgi:hypothetical protein
VEINKNSVKKTKNKEEFVDHIIQKATALVEKNPRLHIHKKIKQLEKMFLTLKQEEDKLDKITLQLEDLVTRAEKEVGTMDIVNNKLREQLLKALLTEKKQRTKKKSENNEDNTPGNS